MATYLVALENLYKTEVYLGTDHLSGGGGFFLVTSYFVPLFTQVIFFSKVNKQVFSENNTLKSKKCK